MHASVTGASGFIGRRLVEQLLIAGFTVTVLTRRDLPAGLVGRVNVVRGDLCRDEDDLRPLLDECDTLYHCAGELYRPEIMEALHVGGTQRLIEAAGTVAERRGKPLHWVNLSSVGAYGPPPESPSQARVVTESYPLRPVGPYEITKTRSDELVMAAGNRQAVTYTIVRPTNVFGESMTNASLRGLLSMIRKRLFVYIGTTEAVANYVHVDDVVAGLIACGSEQAAHNRIFNISNDCPLVELVSGAAHELGVPAPKVRIPEIAARTISAVGSAMPRFPLTQERINALVGRTTYSSQQIQRELGVRASISVASRARAMLAL
ncbi:Aurachin B dehydrogenase [Paraburkholderia domus]|uniref:NAD-dependent epimerase/dehydratase family protein n=1 Tax=Paraburkholderia domus TaxID=2793075 RepID=UPI0019114F7E|nr:NAD-dependent epimerase/dehydratase family protein [Paraburkholderia domus]MBK5052536.1 NAD-dependent epimerase/dehydratase family protein [Burkholderia sp. R-70006]CAE6811994.1 Aurachin B dehydrogenase [Paraburkholderia domus]CAE6889118.1 Aurachin B dehydrogenase [Paraburkholderia domus]